MIISVILGHPNTKSFNYGIYETVISFLNKKGHTVITHDLYRENFDPVITGEELGFKCALNPEIQKYCDELIQSQGLVFIHPNWWGQPPAILKGWIDRILRPKIAYDFPENDNGGGLPIGLLNGKKALVFNTSNTPEKRENEVFGDPLNNIWEKCIFNFCGLENCYRKTFRIVAESSLEERQKWLIEVKNILDEYF